MVEALFFKTYHSFLMGNLPHTRMFFEFLVDEFKRHKNPEALTLKQLKELKKIRSAIESGKIETCQWINESPSTPTDTVQVPDIKQAELIKRLYFEGLKTTAELLKADSLELYDVEHPCGRYGTVDLVYRSQDVFYPIEVKRHEGKHDLIGQISKYALYFRMRLHLKHYTDVQPVTICNSYNQHTLSELKRLFVIPLKYDIVYDKIKITQV
jgi:hypothetical protein